MITLRGRREAQAGTASLSGHCSWLALAPSLSMESLGPHCPEALTFTGEGSGTPAGRSGGPLGSCQGSQGSQLCSEQRPSRGPLHTLPEHLQRVQAGVQTPR